MDPPGRFLTEIQQSKQQDDNSSTSTSTVVIVHPAIHAKSWAIVDLEKAIAKVLHRLREKDRTAANKEGGNNKKSKRQTAAAVGFIIGTETETNTHIQQV